MYCRDLKQGSHADQAQMVVVLDCSIATVQVFAGVHTEWERLTTLRPHPAGHPANQFGSARCARVD
jgi:hypothetical protein